MKYFVEPWPHQRKAIDKAYGRTHFAFFAEMGTGKTAMAINTARLIYYDNGRLLRTLVLCPPVVIEQWRREWALHSALGPRVVCLTGSSAKRRDTLQLHGFATNPERDLKPVIFITNYETLSMKDVWKFILMYRPELLICDESHKLKDCKALRSKKAALLADVAHYRYLLTGSPVLNTPLDLFSQFRVLDRGETFGKNYYAFRTKYFYDKNAGMPSQRHFSDWRPLPRVGSKRSTLDEFSYLVEKKSIRVTKSECLDLPPLVRSKRYVEMSDKQARAYAQMKTHLIAYLDDKACVAQMALTKALRLQQLVSGFFKIEESGDEVVFDPCPRLEALEELLGDIFDTPERKVIVWACWQKNYEMITQMLRKNSWRFTTLYGGLSSTQRQKNIDSFQQDAGVKVMVANQAAGGLGVNLTAASYAVYYSKNFSLEQDMQSEARCHRGGSEIHHKITRLDLITPGSIDELVTSALERKSNLADKILTLRSAL